LVDFTRCLNCGKEFALSAGSEATKPEKCPSCGGRIIPITDEITSTEKNKISAKVWYDDGVYLTESNKYEKALQSYNKSLTFDVNDPNIWNKKCYILNKLAKYDEAIIAGNIGIKLAPNDPMLWENLRDAYIGANNREKADECSKRIRIICPECGENLKEGTIKCDQCESNVNETQLNFTRCLNCGKEFALPAGSEATKTGKCPSCGGRIITDEDTENRIRNPWISTVFSLFFIGWGQWYNGQTWDGLKLFGLWVFLYLLVIRSGIPTIAGILMLILWIYGMFNAYKTADTINKRKESFSGKSVLFWLPLALIVLFILGVFLYVVFG